MYNSYWVRAILISFPAFFQIISFVLYAVTGQFEFLYIFGWMLALTILTKLLKELAYSLSPSGASRPVGATDCKAFPGSGTASNRGMPSGHSASIVALAVYASLYILSNEVESPLRTVFGLLVVLAIAFLVTSSRIVYGCHTLAQVLTGSLVGASFGYGAFRLRSCIEL